MVQSIENMAIYDNAPVDGAFLPLVESLSLMNKFVPLLTTNDGNCYYHSVSRLLSGIEDYYRFIRLGIVKTLIENKESFVRLLRRNGSNMTFISLLLNAASDKQWAKGSTLIFQSFFKIFVLTGVK
jgi:hypothetical protein